MKLNHFQLKVVEREKHRITPHYSAALQTTKQTLEREGRMGTDLALSRS